MEHWRRTAALGFAAGVLVVLAGLGIAGLIVVYSGLYNIAATEDHLSFTRWAFDTTFVNSIERRAAHIQPPQNITPAMIAAGASSYRTMCQHCHAGPGVERATWASGMRPRPPHLVEAASRWEPPEIFWLAKHGAKMTGMPAFGPTHDDQMLWSIAAFVSELPAMTPERYASLTGADQGGGAQQGAGHGGGQHPH